jgi:DNA integrity scanning protein DisA with diadenylate cyclase activity
MTNELPKKYKLKLNSVEKIEELLQELYEEADKNIVEIQNEMNKLSNSVQLNEEIVDAKAKYAKAMNDYISNKDKAIGRKLDIAKLMSEILKYNGNVKMAFTEGNIPDWQEITNALVDNSNDEDNKDETIKYQMK